MPRRLVEPTIALLIAVAGLVATVLVANVHAGWRKREPVYVIPTDLPNHGYHATRWHRWPEDGCGDEGLAPVDVPPALQDAYRPNRPMFVDPRDDDEPSREIERTAPERIEVPSPSSPPATSSPALSSPAEPPRYRTQEWTPRPTAVETSRWHSTSDRAQPTSYDGLLRPHPSQRPSRQVRQVRQTHP